MSKTKIEKYIEQVELDFVQKYNAETEAILRNKEDAFKFESVDLETKTLNKARQEQKEILATTKQALDFEAKSKGEALKSLMIEEIYLDVSRKLKELKGSDLLNFVVGLLLKENFQGEHRILVKKSNLTKYSEAFNDKGNADLLNKHFKNVVFKLDIYEDGVEDGFIVEDQEFDLYFDFNHLLQKHKETHAYTIYQQLFGEK